MGGKASAPPPPNYAAAAQATAAGNLEAAQIAQTQNMVNQVTPQGTVTYTPTQIGTTSSGAPIQQWTQTVQMSPQQQALYDQSQAINQQLGNVAQQGMGYVQTALNKPLDFSNMQALQAPGQIQQQASDAAYANATRYLDPQFARQQAQTENQLANQGITRGSEAWNNAMQEMNATKQQAYDAARNQAYLQGMQGAGQLYNQSLGTRQQQINEAQTLQQNPLNMLNAVRTGQQMSAGQQPNVATSAPGTMATTAGADMLGAASGMYNAQLGAVNAQNAAQSGFMQGLGNLGLGAYGMYKLSDRRLKKNIVRFGTHALGIPLYFWEYVWGEMGCGVMADELEVVMPEAVSVHPSGYKMVNYAMIGG